MERKVSFRETTILFMKKNKKKNKQAKEKKSTPQGEIGRRVSITYSGFSRCAFAQTVMVNLNACARSDRNSGSVQTIEHLVTADHKHQGFGDELLEKYTTT